MKSDADRIDSYEQKTVAATVNLIVAAELPDMRTNFADVAGMSDLVAAEIATQAILNTNDTPVPTIQYPFYLCFCREIWALKRKGISGAQLTLAAQGIRDKWNYKGFLTAGVLDEISLGVFNIVTA